MLSKLKISHKIYLSTAIQFLLIAIVGWVGISQMEKIGTEIKDIAEEDIPLTRSLTLLTEHQLQQAILFEKAIIKALLIQQNPEYPEEKFLQLREKIIKSSHEIEEEIIAIEDFIKVGIDKLHSLEAKKKYKEILAELKPIESDYIVLEKELQKVLDLAADHQFEAVITEAVATEKLQDSIDERLIEILNDVQDFTLEATLKAEHDEKIGLRNIIIAFIASAIVSIILPFIIGRSITKPVQELNQRLKEIATGDGDLTMSLDDGAKDETGEVAGSFNLFMEKLRGIIFSVNQSSNVLGETSEDAISVMEETVANIEKQYTETEVVAHAVSEMSQTIQSVAQSTSDASVIAENVKQRVDEGKMAAAETHSIVKQLANEMDNASSVIQSLAAETENIGSVLDAIRGIAEQTNLLALNAAIEAARAGDTGRGFAVVADEVRSLAQRTQTSTGDIQKLVEGLQSEAGNAVESMKKGSLSTQKCLEKSTETADAFEDASQAVNEISDLNMQIATASEEQSVVSTQINNSLENIKNIAELTNKGAQKTAQSNTNIAKKVIELHSNLNQFQI